jgi:hypothetical protein
MNREGALARIYYDMLHEEKHKIRVIKIKLNCYTISVRRKRHKWPTRKYVLRPK